MGKLTSGLAAGAVGTALLNTTTYLDMAVRGRPASSVPEDDVDRMLERAGLFLPGEGEALAARRTGVAALLGFLTGFTGGVAYALVHPLLRRLPPWLRAALVGLGTMAATDASSAALGTTDPREWGAAGWASDVVPHLVYGAGVVVAHDALAG